MNYAVRSLFFLALAIALPQAGVASPLSEEIAYFGRRADGGWMSVARAELPNYADTAAVACSPEKSQIDVVWDSESGDWRVFDQYRSDGPFFTRVVRFAQFDEVLRVVRNAPASEPQIQIGGARAQDYEFLVSGLATWRQKDSVPFDLPDCASKVFAPR